MLNHAVSQHMATQITNDLVDVNNNSAVCICAETLRFHARIDLLPLPLPILPHGFCAMDSAAFDAIGPVDIGMHVYQYSVDVATVERSVNSCE